MASKIADGCPTIYVMSQIPSISDCLQNIAPRNVAIKTLKLPDVFDRNLELSADQIESMKDAEILLCDGSLLAKTFTRLPKLKWAHCTWAGVEPIISVMKSIKSTPTFLLTRHGGSQFSLIMAEYVLCQILSWERGMKMFFKSQEEMNWNRMERFETRRSLSEIVVCILGVGNMGCAIARVLKGLGSTVMGFCRTQKSTDVAEYSCFKLISTELTEILPKCDYLCNTLPNTDATCGLLNGNALSFCSKKPVFINVGRGSIIEEASLIHAFRNEWLSGAVLDVFETEPLPQSSQLWKLPQVVITPHIAAISKPEHVAEFFIKNYLHYTSDEKLENSVDWSSGY